MGEIVFKNSKKSHVEKLKYFSAPFFDVYAMTKKNLIKNYIIDPIAKQIKYHY